MQSRQRRCPARSASNSAPHTAHRAVNFTVRLPFDLRPRARQSGQVCARRQSAALSSLAGGTNIRPQTPHRRGAAALDLDGVAQPLDSGRIAHFSSNVENLSKDC